MPGEQGVLHIHSYTEILGDPPEVHFYRLVRIYRDNNLFGAFFSTMPLMLVTANATNLWQGKQLSFFFYKY